MKQKALLFILLLLSATGSFAQKKSRQKAPSGTVQVNDTLFVDKTEIANIHWREYLHYLQQFDSSKKESMLPDTLVWRGTAQYNEPLVQYYFRHPMFNDYPVVGISYEQALEFCQWRSERVNEFIGKMPESKRPFEKVAYRLLTRAEWEILSASKLDVNKFPFGYDSTHVKWKAKYVHSFNCKYPDDKPREANHNNLDVYNVDVYTSATNSYLPNSNKMHNTIGNVAEMVSEKGIAKGGSVDHKLEDCKIINDQYYKKPERWLGFRCVAVI
jgi:formylglycine-generating enzyme required for sulfatase activity